MAITLPDARQLSDEVLEALRLRAMRGRELGFTEGDIAEMLGFTRETISRWWTAYSKQGSDALPHERTGRPLGSGRTLSDDQARHIQDLIDNHSPDQLGVACPLWNRRAVRDLIHNEYDIWMPVRTVGEYLKRWGYTAKRPRRHSRDQDPQEVRTWLEETYPLIVAQAKEEDAEIYWGDEAGIGADEYPGVGYARVGQPATKEVPDSHIRVNVISAISNEGALRFMTYKDPMNAALFITFLSRLIRTTTRKVILIVDYLRVHEAILVEDWLESHKDRIDVFYLPHHSPELNPDEYLNHDFKGTVNREGLPDSKDELRANIQRFLRSLLHWGARVASYFEPPSAQYAADL